MIRAVYLLPAKCLGYMSFVCTERRNNKHTLPRQLPVEFSPIGQFYKRMKRIFVQSVVTPICDFSKFRTASSSEAVTPFKCSHSNWICIGISAGGDYLEFSDRKRAAQGYIEYGYPADCVMCPHIVYHSSKFKFTYLLR